MAEFLVSIPTFAENPQEIDLKSGQSAVFLGANGAGKTRLGVHIDRQAGGEHSHRIGAHRALNLNTKVASKSLESTTSDLLYSPVLVGKENRTVPLFSTAVFMNARGCLDNAEAINKPVGKL